jgi:hypothetical protein
MDSLQDFGCGFMVMASGYPILCPSMPETFCSFKRVMSKRSREIDGVKPKGGKKALRRYLRSHRRIRKSTLDLQKDLSISSLGMLNRSQENERKVI